MSLSEALALFARHSLELRMVRADAARLTGALRQAGAYPNPVVSATQETLRSGSLRYRESYLNVTQRLDWPWLAAARHGAAAAQEEAGAARISADSLQLAFEVKRAFVEAVAAAERVEAERQATELVRRVERHGAERAAAGDISGYELRRIQVERVRYEWELSRATLDARALRRRLALLILPGSAVDVAPVGPMAGEPGTPSLTAVLARARTGHPRVLQTQALALSAARGRRAAGAERVPVPQITGGYKSQSDGQSGLFVGLGLSLPLFDRRGATVAAAGAQADAAEAQAQLTALQVDNDVRSAHERFVAARARAELLRQGSLVETDALLQVARVSYDEGEMSLVEMLDAVSAFRVARSAAVDAVAGLWIAYFDLERAAGADLSDLPAEENP